MRNQRLHAQLDSNPEGLSSTEAENRLMQYGLNSLEEKKVNPILKFLSYFWGPIPWMIEIAAILSAIVRHWEDLIIILVQLLFNAPVGFWQEFKAANALDALKNQLALKVYALRDGEWQETPADQLVPGDIIRFRSGEIIPADAKLFKGDFLSVDQSALTGEFLPVSKEPGDIVYSQVIMEMCNLDDETSNKAKEAVDELAAKGYRSLGVASLGNNHSWEFIMKVIDNPKLSEIAETIGEKLKTIIEMDRKH